MLDVCTDPGGGGDLLKRISLLCTVVHSIFKCNLNGVVLEIIGGEESEFCGCEEWNGEVGCLGTVLEDAVA